jgi:hypothetical protein
VGSTRGVKKLSSARESDCLSVRRGLIFRSNHTFMIQRNNHNVRLLDSEARL